MGFLFFIFTFENNLSSQRQKVNVRLEKESLRKTNYERKTTPRNKCIRGKKGRKKLKMWKTSDVARETLLTNTVCPWRSHSIMF
jgi:hypothetical protein